MDTDELDGMAALVDGVTNQSWPHTMDAQIWAEKFCEQFPLMDKATMIGWFANAIMAGFDTASLKARQAQEEKR